LSVSLPFGCHCISWPPPPFFLLLCEKIKRKELVGSHQTAAAVARKARRRVRPRASFCITNSLATIVGTRCAGRRLPSTLTIARRERSSDIGRHSRLLKTSDRLCATRKGTGAAFRLGWRLLTSTPRGLRWNWRVSPDRGEISARGETTELDPAHCYS